MKNILIIDKRLKEPAICCVFGRLEGAWRSLISSAACRKPRATNSKQDSLNWNSQTFLTLESERTCGVGLLAVCFRFWSDFDFICICICVCVCAVATQLLFVDVRVCLCHFVCIFGPKSLVAGCFCLLLVLAINKQK